MPPAAPTPSSARLPLLDAMRGLALFGIFTINVAAFSGFIYMSREEITALPTAAVDGPVGLLIFWFGYGKFYSLFSLLFGIGFALQLESATRDGDQHLRRFRRRLLVLLAIGFVHLTFIWEGDILALYALLGFALIPLRRLSQRGLIVTAAVLLALPVVEQALMVVSHGALDPGAPLVAIGKQWQIAMGFGPDDEPYPVLKYASLGEAVRFQLSGIWFRYGDLLTTGRPFKVLAMFLIGLWVGRSGILRDLEPWAPLLRRVRLLGLAVGVPAALVQTLMEVRPEPQDSPWKLLGSVGYALGVAPLALAYGSHVALLWRRPLWRDRLAWAIPAGRMALTNYLTQTVIGITLFYGIGFGLMGQAGPVTWPLIATIVVVLQAAASWWWLGRFPFGPMEWLWRIATYGRMSADASQSQVLRP